MACLVLAAWAGACVSLDDARAQFCAEHPNICGDGGTADSGLGNDAGPTLDSGQTPDGGGPDSGRVQDAGTLPDGGSPQCIRVPFAVYPAAMATELAAGDLHGNGKPDIVVLEFFKEDALVLSNDGDGTFGAGVPLPWSVDAGLPGGVVIGDFNRDGTVDVALTMGGTLFVSLN
jgi:hypothetical protein